jgi:hypothetical protein
MGHQGFGALTDIHPVRDKKKKQSRAKLLNCPYDAPGEWSITGIAGITPGQKGSTDLFSPSPQRSWAFLAFTKLWLQPRLSLRFTSGSSKQLVEDGFLLAPNHCQS